MAGSGAWTGGRSARRVIAVAYDQASSACQKALEIVRARESSLPVTPTVELVGWPSGEADEIFMAVRGKLRHMDSISGGDFSMDGQMVALLPSGLAMPNCQDDVMQLIAEMEYLSLVQPPLHQTLLQIEQHHSSMRDSRRAGIPGRWWRAPKTISQVADALHDTFFCIIDDFLSAELAERLAASILRSRPEGFVPAEGSGGWTRGGTARAAEAIHSEGDFTARNELLARTLMNPSRGDIIRFSDSDGTLDGTEDFASTVDALVLGLKGCPRIAERLRHTDFSNSAMFAVYPGGAARYVKHTDNSLVTDGRRLTTILYLNRGWEPPHGGQLRIFEPTMQSVRVKADVEPLWNRLVVFWSTEEVPHEVLPSYRDRMAVSLWYVCARECLQTEEAFKRLATKCRCIGGGDRVDRMVAAGSTEEQRRVLRTVARDPAGGGAHQPEAEERRKILSAIEHDFAGCAAHRQQRERLDRIFGWDDHAAEVGRSIMQAQLQQCDMFRALGLPLPPGLRINADMAMPQTSAPAFTEEFCRRTQRKGQDRSIAAPAATAAASWESDPPAGASMPAAAPMPPALPTADPATPQGDGLAMTEGGFAHAAETRTRQLPRCGFVGPVPTGFEAVD